MVRISTCSVCMCVFVAVSEWVGGCMRVKLCFVCMYFIACVNLRSLCV